MLRVAMLVVGVALVARPATAVVGDLNADGKVATLRRLYAGDVVFRELLQRLFREGSIPLEDQGGDREALPDFVCGVIVAVLSHVASLCIAGAGEVPSIPGLVTESNRHAT